jgi:quinol monooxygenase YgiN
MSVMITLELPTKSESMAELLEVMKSALVDTRSYAGCQKVETFIDQESQNVFLVEQWKSAEHQQAYMGWRVETGFMNAVGPLLDGAPVARVFDIKSDI